MFPGPGISAYSNKGIDKSDPHSIPRIAQCPGVVLVPIGEVDPITLAWLKEDIPMVLPTTVRESPPLPHSLHHFRKERNQYLADGLLADLSSTARDGNTLTLGITGADLFSPGLNYVFGIACMGRALISIFRLRPEFYGMAPNQKVFQWRVLTEAIHELGHALGLPHCEYPGCVMYFSNWIGDTDRKGPKFCYRCRRRIEWVREAERQK